MVGNPGQCGERRGLSPRQIVRQTTALGTPRRGSFEAVSSPFAQRHTTTSLQVDGGKVQVYSSRNAGDEIRLGLSSRTKSSFRSLAAFSRVI
jgi:hypothetical protein